MKTVSREMSECLKKAGWVKETYFSWYYTTTGSYELHQTEWVFPFGMISHIYSPTPDELMEDLEIEDFMLQYERENPKFEEYSYTWQTARFEWLDTTMRSADALAEVWIKVKGKEVKE